MSEVSVDSSLILQAKKLCVSAEKAMKGTITLLNKGLNSISAEWKDQKAKEFEYIVNQCITSLKQPLDDLHRCDSYLQRLGKALEEYEYISFGKSSINGCASNEAQGDANSAVASNSFRNIFSRVFNRNHNIYQSLRGVDHNPIKPASSSRTEQQIISAISGGDETEGSCSSLALAYAGNRAGYVVFDYRGGQSRAVFSSRSSIEQIANLDGVNSVITHGRNDAECAERLMVNMQRDREYYLATGRHAAVVRINENGTYQYLELQSGIESENGWQPLTQRALYERFGCRDGHNSEWSNYLIELDSLQNNSEFLNILGYINTNESAQMRGENGHVR